MRNIDPALVFDFPGLHPLNSAEEATVLERRRVLLADRERELTEGLALRYSGPLADAGLIQPELRSYVDVIPIAPDYFRTDYADRFDELMLIRIDERLRVCRFVLDKLNLPWDRDRVFQTAHGPGWGYAGQLDEAARQGGAQDPLMFVLAGNRHHSPGWYAAKILAHWRRAADLLTRKEAGAGLTRELVLFGETWTAAAFLANHGRKVIGRHESNTALDRGQDALASHNSSLRADATRWQAEAREIAGKSRLSGGALVKYVKGQLASRGIEKAKRTIRRALEK